MGRGGPDLFGGQRFSDRGRQAQRVDAKARVDLLHAFGEQRLDAIWFNFSATPGDTVRAAYRLAINDRNRLTARSV